MYRMQKKLTAKPTEGESTPQHKRKVLYEHRPSEAGFPAKGLLVIKKIH
jgi:hypothetical protein